MLRFCALLLVGFAVALGSTIKPEDEHKAPTAPGKCPEFTGMATHNATKMSGEWFVVKCGKVGFEKPKEPKRCVKKFITINPAGGASTKLTFMKGDQAGSHELKSTPINGQSGKFTVTSPEFPNKTCFGTVLDADYTNFAVGCLCKEDGDKHGYIVEVLSRQKTLDPAFAVKVQAALDAAQITVPLEAIEQNC